MLIIQSAQNPSFKFIKKNVGTDSGEDDLSSYFKKANSVFLKMDIEGGERNIINYLCREGLIEKVSQMVVEFHSPFNQQNFRNINNTHTLYHFHVNNYSYVYAKEEIDRIEFPAFFECTYVRNDLIKSKTKNKEKLPISLDFENMQNFPQVDTNFEPLVNPE